MLPSRGIVRALPSGAFQRRQTTRAVSHALGNARQFGTALRSPRSALVAGARVNGKGFVAPTVLAGVSTSRNLSLWGYGKKTEKPAEDAATTTATETATEPPSKVAIEATPSPETVIPSPTAGAENTVAPTDIDLASIADLGNANILNMEEGLGYLKALGLDYGWGPTSVMQWVLEHVHVYSGLGWGGSIIATAVLLRIVMFYPQVRSMRFNAAMTRMKDDPRQKEALEYIKKGYQANDRELMQKGQFLGKMVRQEYGASNTGMVWAFLQIPFSFGLFRILGGMASIPVPALENAGFLWFQDLTVSDPFFILPAVGSGLLFGAMMINSKYSNAEQKAMMKKMMWVFGTVGFIGTTFLSAGVNLMMVTTGCATLITAVLLNNPTIRGYLNLPILQVQEVKYEAPRPTSTGVAGIRERLTHNLEDMKKSMSDNVTSYTGKYAGTEAERKEQERKDKIRKFEQTRRQLEREDFEKRYKSGR